MSVRTADVVAQAEKARVFSLRDAFAGAPAVARTPAVAAPLGRAASAGVGGGVGGPRVRFAPATVPLTAASASVAARAVPASASAPALTLKFSPPSQAPKAPTNLPAEVLKSLPVTNSISGKRSGTVPMGATGATAAVGPASAPSAPTAPVGPVGATMRKVYPATAESARADVMRLAAMVDDLQKKLGVAQSKATAAERNAANAAQRATVDRTALSNKVHVLQKELAVSMDTTEKTRIELKAVSNAKFEVDAAKTSMHEQEVLALQQTKSALLETMTGLQREHDGLKAKTQELYSQVERKRAMAQAKAESAAALEASTGQRMEAVRASEEAEHRRLATVRAEVKEAEEALAQLKAAGQTPTEAPLETPAAKVEVSLPAVDALPAAWTDDETRRAEQACGCCAYGVPATLLGASPEVVAAWQSATSATSGPARAAEPEQTAATALACAVEQDLLENYKANLYENSVVTKRRDVASMYPVDSSKNGQSGYEGVRNKKNANGCEEDKE
tara:strand:- start:1477 stop:2991 length:1515 start_codon:yes stop_codon:yes gene_type:complete